MGESIEVKDVQKTEYLDKNGLDMLWAKVKENTHNQVEIERNRAVAKENSITNSLSEFVSKTTTDGQYINSTLGILGGNTISVIDYTADGDPVSLELASTGLEFNGSDISTIELNGSDVNSNNGSRIIIKAHNENPQIVLQSNVGSNYAFQDNLTITNKGISNADNNANHVYATDGSLADLTQYALSSTLAALEQKVTANTTAISAKQDAGNYIPYTTTDNETIGDSYVIDGKNGITNLMGSRSISFDSGCLFACDFDGNNNPIEHISIDPHYGGSYSNAIEVAVDGQNPYTIFAVNWEDGLTIGDGDGNNTLYTGRGIHSDQYHNCLATSDASFKPISDFVLKTELPTVPTKLSQLTNDSNFITAADIDFTPYATIEALTAVEQKVAANTTAIANINKSNGIPYDTNITNYYQTDKPFYIKCDNDHTAYINPYSGIKVASSDTSYVDITPSSMRLSNGDASCEINQYIGIQGLLGTSDDSYGFKLSPYGLRIGKKSDINANNNELISISIPLNGATSSFEVNQNNGIKLSINDSQVTLNTNGITIPNGDDNHVLTSQGSTIDITNYVLKSVYDEKIVALEARIAALEAKHTEATA